MIMVSGIPPYQYDIDVPFRSDKTISLAHSGIFLEQAMFVLNAERRRLNGEIDNNNFDWRLYTSLEGANRGFEPTGSGFWMGNSSSPVWPLPGLVLNYILTLRENFFKHLSQDGFVEDSDFLPEEFRRDWIHNAYPTSPSGFNQVTDASGEGNYFRGAPKHPGFQLSTDIGILGTSGVLFDIDFGEVMYNPYPRIGRTLFGEGHVLTHQDLGSFRFNNSSAIYNVNGLPIPISPVFPAFQTTSGTIVSTTSRDIRDDMSRYWYLGVGDLRVQYPFNSLHISSGVIRLDGDLLKNNTSYFIGDGGVNAKEDFRAIGEFAFYTSGIRPIGRPVYLNFTYGTRLPSGQNSTISRVFLSPVGSVNDPVESGIYHLAVANSGVQSIPSGVVSHWPSGNPGQVSPGYQVFDDCIWLRDQSANLNASGLAIISPLDGTAMWIRFADLSNISLVGNLTVPQNILAFSRLNYPGLIGMARTGKIIYMIYPVLSSDGIDSSIPTNPTPGVDNVKYYVGEYNDMLNLTTTLESAVQAFDSSTQVFPNPMGDIMFDGTSFWVCARNGTEIAKLNTSLTWQAGYDRTGSDICRRLAFFNSKYWAYGEDSSSEGNVGALQELTLSGGNFILGTIKTINSSPLPLLPTSTGVVVDSVHHVINAANGDHVVDGVWACVRTQDENAMGIISSSARMWILRIVEGSTTFTISEFYQIFAPPKKAAIPLNGSPNQYDIVHMPVNPGAF